MQRTKETLYEGFKAAHTRVFKVPTESDFGKTGMLTYAEFVDAGDALVANVPTWRWRGCHAGQGASAAPAPSAAATSGEALQLQPALPEGKRYLEFADAPCYRRAATRPAAALATEVPLDDGGTLLVLKEAPGKTAVALEEEAIEIDWTADDDDDGEAEAEAEADKGEGGGAAGRGPQTPQQQQQQQQPAAGEEATRLYDVYVCFDDYHRVPCLFLAGKTADGARYLSPAEMAEDVRYYGHTVTPHAHPYLPALPCVRVHPCRYAEAMAANIQEHGGAYPVHKAIGWYVKLASTLMPTIHFDLSDFA